MFLNSVTLVWIHLAYGFIDNLQIFLIHNVSFIATRQSRVIFVFLFPLDKVIIMVHQRTRSQNGSDVVVDEDLGEEDIDVILIN